MKIQTFTSHILMLFGVIIILSGCQSILDRNNLQEKIDIGDIPGIQDILENSQNTSGYSWQELHNLGYLSYIVWEDNPEDISFLEQSYRLFLESFEISGDMRTEHNIELIRKLLEEIMQNSEQDQENQEENGEGENESEENDSENSESPENSEEESEGDDNSSEENTEQDSGNPQNTSSSIGTPSIPMFEELGYESEEELLQELDRYTQELQDISSRYQPYIGQQFNENNSPFDDIFSEFFGGRGGLFRDIPNQGEKDW